MLAATRTALARPTARRRQSLRHHHQAPRCALAGPARPRKPEPVADGRRADVHHQRPAAGSLRRTHHAGTSAQVPAQSGWSGQLRLRRPAGQRQRSQRRWLSPPWPWPDAAHLPGQLPAYRRADRLAGRRAAGPLAADRAQRAGRGCVLAGQRSQRHGRCGRCAWPGPQDQPGQRAGQAFARRPQRSRHAHAARLADPGRA